MLPDGESSRIKVQSKLDKSAVIMLSKLRQALNLCGNAKLWEKLFRKFLYLEKKSPNAFCAV